jgi:arginyl-tRNA synthetase
VLIPIPVGHPAVQAGIVATIAPMSFDPIAILTDRFKSAIKAALPAEVLQQVGGDPDPLIAASKNPQFGDFQCNAAMALAKVAGKPPREIATAIVAHSNIGDIAEALTPQSIAGPGFINIKLKPAALSDLLAKLDAPALGVALPSGSTPQTIVVDLCGVNLAKQMHVGHLRSVIIGDALARTLARLGHRVIRQNHVGDWGLPIAMVVARLEIDTQLPAGVKGRVSLDTLRLDDLERLYKAAQRECDADDKGLAAAKKWWSHPKAVAELEAQVGGASEALAKGVLLRLQQHEPTALAIWQRIVDVTMKECLATCARLHADVTREHSAGESAYAEELAPMVEDLLKRGIAEIDEGAVVIRVEGFEEPCLIRRSEAGGGGFLYATTDMAAVRRRVQTFGASRVVYCVDIRQGLHFKLVFGACRKAGFDVLASGAGGGHASLEHAANGTILGEDNRPLKTRSGENVKLSDLLDEAVERAGAAVTAKSPDLPESERAAIAETVGIAAIRYAELSANRASDYVFAFDRMLAFEGNTGPYLLYALVRLKNIQRKAAQSTAGGGAGGAPVIIDSPDEKNLALALLRYPASVLVVANSLEPHRLCQYLYDLAGAFSTFYNSCHVLDAETPELRASRLRLCALTERVLADGLSLLGIRPLERM